jgi:hypothetical protein
MHDPAGAEIRKRAAQKGGFIKALGSSPLSEELAAVRAELCELTEDLREKRISPAIGAVLVQCYNAQLRALAEERKTIVEDVVEDRVRALEERLASYKSSSIGKDSSPGEGAEG